MTNRPQRLREDEKFQVQFPLCAVDLLLSAISEALEIPFDQWYEPGMGPASGFGCRLPSGEMVFLLELEYARASFKLGPTVYIEAEMLAQKGIEECVGIVLAGLGLPRDCLQWIQSEEGRESARVTALAAEVRKAKRNGI